MEKVRDIVNNAFANLFPIDEPSIPSMEVDEYKEQGESAPMDAVEPSDRLMCEIADEIPF